MTTSTLFHSPILCGCVLEHRKTFKISDAREKMVKAFYKDLPHLAELTLQHLTNSGAFDDTHEERFIVAVCDDHAHLNADGIYEELKHFQLTEKAPATCGCRVVLSWDKRHDSENRTHTPISHPAHTVVCEHHAHYMIDDGHVDAQALHDEINTELEQLQRVQLEAAAVYKVPPQEVPWKWDQDRKQITVDTAKFVKE